MVVLANHPNWQVYPEEIAKRKGVSRDTVDSYFKTLEKNGYLRIVKKGKNRKSKMNDDIRTIGEVVSIYREK